MSNEKVKPDPRHAKHDEDPRGFAMDLEKRIAALEGKGKKAPAEKPAPEKKEAAK